jgi:two-component system nitrogen regulation response regulator GlnG
VIHADDLPALSAGSDDEPGDWAGALREWTRRRLQACPGAVMAEARERLESVLIDEALKATGGRRADAARLLGIGRNTLARKRAGPPGGRRD